MSRKTVSRGATAAALATLLTLASAAPTLAAPRHSQERSPAPRIGGFSLVLDLSLRMTRWYFGVDRPTGVTQKLVGAMDPNGQEMANNPTAPSPVPQAPSVGGN